MITEYTDARAEALSRLHIPELQTPLPIKILWLENLESNDVSIYKSEHAHSFFEIHFVFSGEVCYEIGGEMITLGENEALLLPPNTVHRFVRCSEDFFKNSLAFTIEGGHAPHILLSMSTLKKFSFSRDITENMNFILKQSEVNDFFTPTLVGGRILEIIYSVFGILEIGLPQNQEADGDSRLWTAKLFIENNRHRLISCEDVARECCLSRKQLNRIFRKYTGQTLQDYIMDARAQYAEKLVLQTRYSIKEISYMLGFENVCGFVSFFKRHFGSPPGSYRTESRDTEQKVPVV